MVLIKINLLLKATHHMVWAVGRAPQQVQLFQPFHSSQQQQYGFNPNLRLSPSQFGQFGNPRSSLSSNINSFNSFDNSAGISSQSSVSSPSSQSSSLSSLTGGFYKGQGNQQIN
ncbi:hypothetical protein WR25_25211 [Diploscapter pachys]|uniref:Uncharacterized protein n=1 Tax=Diploscapter pachys TaxID=2018661 RepID=A0A2A2LFF3_9BILA|nr:hypothetical protein WR25_25211 [Diploscapter pachys]